MLGLPVEDVNEWANRAYIIFGIFAIGATALALIASFFIWRTGAALSRISDEKIAAAQMSAGKANESAGKLAKEAAEARVEQERLRVHSLELELRILELGPRRFTEAMADRVSKISSSQTQKPEVSINYIVNPEAAIYAESIAQALRRAGFSIKKGATAQFGFNPGLSIYDSSGTLQSIFDELGLEYKKAVPFSNGSSAEITVGEKILK